MAHNQERGFIATPALYGLIGAIAVAGALGIALTIQSSRLDAVKANLARVEAEYGAFKAEAARLGKVAQEKFDKSLQDRERIANERIKSLGLRAAAAAARADSLCKSAGLSAGCRSLPAVPTTTRPTDDAGFNERLLEVLRHAQTVADQLAELQEWVRAQQAAQ